jgi:hypothetical protein
VAPDIQRALDIEKAMHTRRETQDTHSFPLNPKNLTKLYRFLFDAMIESEVKLTFLEEKQSGLTTYVHVKVTGDTGQLDQFATKMAGAPCYTTFVNSYRSSYYD